MSDHKRLRVVYILSYYAPDYVRTQTLLEALRGLNRVQLYTAINQSITFLRYFETLFKLLVLRVRHNPDCYILGFRGYELFWFVRVIAWGKLLIFDHLMSPYDSLLNETKKLKEGSLLERLVYLYEKTILSATDIVLTDTVLHQKYFADLFHISIKKIHAIPVGAYETLFRLDSNCSSYSNEKSFEVLFYGSFLPLHGIEVILEVAAILRDKPIHFLLIGGNRLDLTDFHQQVEDLALTNVTHQVWVDYDKLPALIMQADVCLGGPFGNTMQGRRVVTGKTFQSLAMGKPTVVGEINQDYGFKDKVNSFLVQQGDSQALADAIKWAMENRAKLQEIGHCGRELYDAHFSIDCIKTRLDEVLPC